MCAPILQYLYILFFLFLFVVFFFIDLCVLLNRLPSHIKYAEFDEWFSIKYTHDVCSYSAIFVSVVVVFFHICVFMLEPPIVRIHIPGRKSAAVKGGYPRGQIPPC